MTSEEPVQRDWKTIWIIALAVVVVVLVGGIIGFVASGGLSDDTSTVVGSTTTTPSTSSLAPTTAPTTAPPASVTTTSTASTDPPGQTTLLAIEDTYTDASDPQEVNGFDGVIELENDAPDVKQGLVRFDVAGFPQDAIIQQVVLRLVPSVPPAPIAVHLVEGEWNETETGANNAPAVGDRVGTIQGQGAAQGSPIEVDLTGVVTGPGPIDFYLLATGEDTVELASRESGANGPSLIVRWSQ